MLRDRNLLLAGSPTTDNRLQLSLASTTTAGWYQIRFSDTVTGWMHGDYVQIHGSLTGLPVR